MAKFVFESINFLIVQVAVLLRKLRQAENGVPVMEGDSDLCQRLQILEDENKHLQAMNDDIDQVRGELEHYKQLYASLQQQCQDTKTEVRSSLSPYKIMTLSFFLQLCSQEKENCGALCIII